MDRVGIIGCGLMGSGIAEVCARAGSDVIVREANDELLRAGEERIRHSLDRAVSAKKLSEAERDATMARLRFTVALAEFSDREIVFEAVSEQIAIKTAVFQELDRVTPPDAVLASNTSSIPIIQLAMATEHPERVVGVHFFNPVPVLPLVEITRSLRTDDTVVQRVEEFATKTLGKEIVQAQDRAGFIVNTLLLPYLLDAIRMLESGYATAEDIDRGMEAGCAHPMGPLRLADLIGLDTVKSIAEVLYEEYKEPRFGAPPLLLRMVEAGWLGRKSGRGFHEYA